MKQPVLNKGKRPAKGRPGRTNSESQKIFHRIARIEGQLRGIRRMISEKKECIDIIAQISAIRSATAMLGMELLKDDLFCRRKISGVNEKYLETLFKLN